MTTSHSPAGRGRVSALATFLASPASDALKADVNAILADLDGYGCLDETLLGQERPDLLGKILTLTPVGVDLFRLLRGERSLLPRHARSHVSALLRAKRRQTAGALTEADFPADHHVRLLADVFWGGVAAWAQAAPGRAQKLKGYWREKANQVAALRRFAAEHPHTPITQATLNAAGLHALAVALPAGLLEARVREAGLQRNLARRPNGHWTKAAVIARYAALCEQAGTALTNHMLAQAGGDGYTIRVQVGMLFGDFHAFRQAVALVHPHLAPDARPVTADGVLLDSFQEVVVYEALRRALPAGTSIVPHVLLADGAAQRSADFLVAGTVFVEVLMIALCEIAEPRSRTQRAYAAKWQAKAEWYAVANRPLVIVEPEDVAQPNRLARKVDEVLGRLGLSSPAEIRPAASTGKTTRPKGFWTFKALCEVVATVARQVGGFPTHADLTAAGYGNAALMLRRGMRRRVAETIGVPLRNAKGVWNLDRVQRELAAWVDAHGHFPSITELKATGHGNLASAWSRACNGRTETLRPAVERICGRRLPRRRVPNGSYATQEGLASILQPLCAELGRFPNRAEVTAAGLSPAVWAMVSTRHGVRAMAAFMGVPYAGPRRREG